MMARRRKVTPVVQEYRRQRKRVQSLIRRYEKQGLMVNLELPSIPKRITQGSVNRLVKLTPERVRRNTIGVDVSTGEILSYNRARAQQRRQRMETTAERGMLPLDMPFSSDIVISNFRSNITIWNETAQSIILRWLDTVIDKFGKEKVAKMLQDAEEQGMLPNYKIVYDAVLLRAGLAEMLDLMEVGNFERDRLQDELEYEESYEY